jgi:hypothetical protein
VVACTIVKNAAGPGGEAGGVWSAGGNGTLPGGFLNNIVAGNAGQSPDVYDAFNSLRYNLVGITNGSSGFSALGDLAGSVASPIDPQVAPLADNGGPTLTMALMYSSPALDAGDSIGAPATDQRGIVRPQGRGVDIGAFEFQFTSPVITSTRLLSPSEFWLQSSGLPNHAYTLQTSTNLLAWFDLTNFVASSNGTCELTDCNLGNCNARFYRLKLRAP